MENRQRNSSPPGSYLDIIRNWPVKKKVSLGLVLCVTLIAFVLLIQLYRASDYQLLYGSLKPEEMTAISRWLDSNHIGYRENYETGDLYVPSDRAHTIRAKLAEQDYVQYPHTGHELLDKSGFAPLGAAAENSYTMALQRELARTIGAFDHVRSAQVYLSAYHRGAAADKMQSATIVLSLEPGKRALDEQLQAMNRLVSGAVAGLAPGRIRIINSNGTVLLDNYALSNDHLNASDALAYQRSLEQMLETRALGIIEMLIGSGPAHVTVAADIDFAVSETTEERYDPENPVIRKEESSQQISDGTASEADTQSSYQDAYSGAVSSDSKLEYEINKTTSKTVRPLGAVDRLSVTILIPEKKLQQSEDGVSYLPLSSVEFETIEAAVSTALALKPERGDVLHLSSIPVVDSEIISAASKDFTGIDMLTYLPLFRILLFSILFLLAYILLVRPIISILQQEKKGLDEAESIQEPQPEREPRKENEDLLPNVRADILANPSTAVHVVRKWIKEA